MTRRDFIDNVTVWSELLEFCSDNGCDVCCDVYDEYDKDEYISNDLVDVARECDSWERMLEMLNEIPTGYDYYIHRGGWDFQYADDEDFDSLKNEVLDWADDEGDVWEAEDEDDDDYDDDYDEEPEDDVEEHDGESFDVDNEGCTIMELMESGMLLMKDIDVQQIEAKAKDDAAFEELLV